MATGRARPSFHQEKFTDEFILIILKIYRIDLARSSVINIHGQLVISNLRVGRLKKDYDTNLIDLNKHFRQAPYRMC